MSSGYFQSLGSRNCTRYRGDQKEHGALREHPFFSWNEDGIWPRGWEPPVFPNLIPPPARRWASCLFHLQFPGIVAHSSGCPRGSGCFPPGGLAFCSAPVCHHGLRAGPQAVLGAHVQMFVIYRASPCHMSLKLQCPFPAEIISTKSGSYYHKRRADVMIYYYLWSQGLVYARRVRCVR